MVLGIFSKKKIKLFIFFGNLFLLTSCSSLFYFPSRKLLFNPEAAQIKPQDVWIQMPQKGQVHGWYFRQNSQKKAKAVVVLFHGNAGNVSSHFLNLYWIGKYALDFFLFDYRGFGKSNFHNSKEGISQRSTVEDGVAVLDWISNQKPSLPLVVIGQSLGGAVAPQSVFHYRDKSKVKILFLESTFHSYKSVMSSVMSKSWITWPFQWIPYLTVPSEYDSKNILSKLSPLPIIILHGNKDPSVSYELGRNVYDLVKEPKEFWHVEDGSHINSFWMHEGVFRKKFIQKIYQEIGSSYTNELTTLESYDYGYAYSLPFEKGLGFKVLQGRGGSFSHTGSHFYAIDFDMPVGSRVCAAREGVVVDLKDGFLEGGPQGKFVDQSNFVVISHSDASFAEYYHLEKGSVGLKLGDRVRKGQCFANSGKSGFVSGPHLHFMVFKKDKNGKKISLPSHFNFFAKEGQVLKVGQSYFH